MKAVLRALLVLITIGALVGGGLAYSVLRRGLSARAEPSAIEELLARSMRRLAMPPGVRAQQNPVAPTPSVLEDSLAHFADHCASCHGNNGSGETALGQGFYPKAPDMRGPATQELTDGELFSIIENGIRLTGMPAWSTGTPEGEHASWTLVHFIRRLPSITAEDIARMEELNPKSPEQFREEEETRRFLEGEDASPARPPGSRHTRKPHH